MPSLRALCLGVAAFALLASCSQSPTPGQTAAAKQAAANAQVAQKLKLYREMLAEHDDALAAPIGKEIVSESPGTAAAAEVRKTLPQVETRASAKAEQDRLAALWQYQTADVDGLQHTASIYSSQPTGADKVRLVLRRHVKWGQSAYLFGNGRGFVCKDMCKVKMRFDGHASSWEAYLPKTGEPAMFINDDKRFIADLEKAKVVEMDVNTRDHGRETLKYDVGGYDPSKFLPLRRR
jgi:hypothetical protein